MGAVRPIIGKAGDNMKSTDKLFRLELMGDTGSRWLGLEDFTRLSESEGRACFRYRRDGWDIDVEIERWRQGKETLSRGVLQNNGEGAVKSFQYPIREYTGLSTFDKLLMSSAWGDRIPRPSKTIHDVAASPSIRFDQDYIRYRPDEVIYTYPSIMAMQYMTLFNETRSFYLATYSTSDETMTFHGKSTGKFSVELSVVHYPFLKTGSWRSPDCGEAALGGGWHEAADLYRSHMGNQFHTPDYPEWMKTDYHGWTSHMIKLEKEPLFSRFRELPSIYREIREASGMEHLFLVGWHDNGHDTMFPRYRPCEEAGTGEELREAIGKIHAMGGRVSLYTNARLIDIYGEFYRNDGKNAVSRDENGGEYHEDYHTQSLYAVSCPGCPEYAEQMAGVAKRICEEYGADGMFVDQISCNLDPFCYDERHGHAKPSANFLPGVETELTGIRRATREINPEFHTFAEGCHERFNQFYDVNQGHGEEYTWQIGESLPEQFLYTYPDRIVTGMCSDKQQMYHSMAQFKPLDVSADCRDDVTNQLPLKKYLALRKTCREYFFGARFLDDAGFRYEKGVRLFAVRAGDGSVGICLWRPGADESTACTARYLAPEGYSNPKALDFSPTAFSVDGGWVEVKWTGALTFLTMEPGESGTSNS